MATERKNFDWIDTIRVFATVIVIVFHYVVIFPENPNVGGVIYKYFFGIGDFGIPAFFGISGYLVVSSLDRSESLWDFYRKKLIRVVCPFTALYIIVIIMLEALTAVDPTLLRVLGSKDEVLVPIKVIGGLFPFDINLMKYFDFPHYFIVGEWFVGTIVLLYLVAPPVYKFLKLNVPLTLIGLVAIAAVTANFLVPLEQQGKILAAATFFVVRLPEFATGMILFMYRDKIFRRQAIFFGILLAGVAIFYALNFMELHSEVARQSIWMSNFFGDTTNLHFILVAMLTVYLMFVAADLLNKIFPAPLKRFNSFKDISYMALLEQHLVIRIFGKIFNLKALGVVELILIFVAVTVAVILIAKVMYKIYTPIEKKLLQL